MQKEEAQQLTEQLDQEWKSIQALMVKKTPKTESTDQPEVKPKVRKHRSPEEMSFASPVQDLMLFLHPSRALQLEDYDMMVRELGFEMKAQPSEKMKSPEELAREAKEKLQKLEVCSQC